jgi:hypothetical protein
MLKNTRDWPRLCKGWLMLDRGVFYWLLQIFNSMRLRMKAKGVNRVATLVKDFDKAVALYSEFLNTTFLLPCYSRR